MTGYADISMSFAVGYIRHIFLDLEFDGPKLVFDFLRENYETTAKKILEVCEEEEKKEEEEDKENKEEGDREEKKKKKHKRNKYVEDLVERYSCPVEDLPEYDYLKVESSQHVEFHAQQIMGIV